LNVVIATWRWTVEAATPRRFAQHDKHSAVTVTQLDVGVKMSNAAPKDGDAQGAVYGKA
jgi:hypothetical protein